MKIPTISDYIDNEWLEGDGLPGPAYRRKYGVEPNSDIAMGKVVLDPIVQFCADLLAKRAQ